MLMQYCEGIDQKLKVETRFPEEEKTVWLEYNEMLATRASTGTTEKINNFTSDIREKFGAT